MITGRHLVALHLHHLVVHLVGLHVVSHILFGFEHIGLILLDYVGLVGLEVLWLLTFDL